MTFDFSQQKSVSISMDGYLQDLLQKSGIPGTVKTPCTEYLFTEVDSEPLSAEKKQEFHTLTAKLLYLAKRTRPDILLSVSYLTTKVIQPSQNDWVKLERVIKYLNGTQNLCIKLSTGVPTLIQAFCDASYGTHDDGKSHTGLVVSLGDGPISVSSTKQKIVTKSSTEAELVALSDGASPVIDFQQFLKSLGEAKSSAIIYQDNQSTIAMVSNGSSKSDRTRHINIRYFWTKERVDKGDISIQYCPTNDMIADILTKPLQGDKFVYLRNKLLNMPV
jgi:hypothetical protein